MAFSYGFFDAKNLDRIYTAQNFNDYLSSLICNGIHDNYGQCFEITASVNGLSVTIGTGKAWINGHYFINDSPYVLDLSRYAEQALSKYVIIGICCNTGDNFREISITVEPGAGADAPEIPSFFETPTETYLTLAAVYLPAGVDALSSDNIVDYRDDASKCGYVKCILGKCGVTELQAAFSELESSLSMLEMQLNSLSETVDTFINSGGGGGGGDCNCGPKLDALEDRIAALEDFAAKGGFVGPGPAPGPGPGTGGDGPNVWFGTAIYGTIATMDYVAAAIYGVRAVMGVLQTLNEYTMEED